jgi:hypothetical protein
MSEVPAFHSVLLVGESGVSSFLWQKKQWVAGPKLDLDAPISAKDQAELAAKSTLILVSDRWAGHLQMILPNKKSDLTDEHIGQVLSEQYQIDVAAYEFALQNFSVSRDLVQVSVSGLEKDIFQKIENWAQQLDTHKVWIMPFSWFLAALKSVEPALLAVAEDADTIFISHQYLGVDDGRVLPLTSLLAYVQARKKERKETHLLYIHTSDVLRNKIQATLGDVVSLQTLLPEHSRNLFLDIVAAVLAKGSDTLAELLHFEVEIAPKPQPVAEATPEPAAEEPAPAVAEPVAPPTLPEPVVETIAMETELPETPSDSGLVAPVPPESIVAAERTRSTKVEVVEPDQAELTVIEPTPAPPTVAEAPVVGTEKPAVPPTPEPAADKPELVSMAQRLHTKAVATDNQDRYVPVVAKKSWKLLFGVMLLVAIVTGVIGGAIFWSQQTLPANTQLSTNVTPTPVPTATPQPTPSPTPVPAAANTAKAGTKILLLNATGISGLASKEKARLVSLGWKKIDTGNATGSYQDAYFVSGKATTDVMTALTTDLAVSTKQVTTIKEDNVANYDVVIVIGTKPSR